MMSELSMIAPPAIAAVVILIIALFSPGLLPTVGRSLGRLVRKEIKRRTGITVPLDTSRQSRMHDVEVIEVAMPVNTPVVNQPQLVSQFNQPQTSTKNYIFLWTISAITAFAGVAWWLFRSR